MEITTGGKEVGLAHTPFCLAFAEVKPIWLPVGDLFLRTKEKNPSVHHTNTIRIKMMNLF